MIVKWIEIGAFAVLICFGIGFVLSWYSNILFGNWFKWKSTVMKKKEKEAGDDKEGDSQV